jgi:hypothetical protein
MHFFQLRLYNHLAAKTNHIFDKKFHVVKELIAACSLFVFENAASYEKLRNNSTITSHWKGIEYKTIKENVEMLQVKSILNRMQFLGALEQLWRRKAKPSLSETTICPHRLAIIHYVT